MSRQSHNKPEPARHTGSQSHRPHPYGREDVESLVREIQAGKSGDEAFNRFFRRFLPPVVHFLANRGLARQDAEDLAQEVMGRVYKNIGSFRFESSFETWLFRIVANAWKNELRSRGTIEGRAEKVPIDRGDDDVVVSELSDPAQDPLAEVLAQERTSVLMEALEELPPKMRQCVLLRVGHGLKYREIAEVMGVSMSTVKTQLISAYQRLRPLLKEHFDG